MIHKKEIPVKNQPSVTFNGIRRLHDQDKRFGFSASVSCTRGNARSSVQSRSDYFLEKLIEQPCSPRSFPWKPSSRVSAACLYLPMQVLQNIDLAWRVVSPDAS